MDARLASAILENSKKAWQRRDHLESILEIVKLEAVLDYKRRQLESAEPPRASKPASGHYLSAAWEVTRTGADRLHIKCDTSYATSGVMEMTLYPDKVAE